MLIETLDVLGPDDVLVLDRGYPAAWLVALLNALGIRFVMRCDNDGGWRAAKTFMRSGLLEANVSLNAPSADEVRDWACPAGPATLRLVRLVARNGQVRLLAINLDAEAFPPELFGDLYHPRWRIEEALKRLKHRLHLEAVSGLSQQALLPRLVLFIGDVLADISAAVQTLAATSQAAAVEPQLRLCW